jgi:hypothetical protein
MGYARIIYQEWIVQLGRDPIMPRHDWLPTQKRNCREIISAVAKAMVTLEREEEEFIRLFYLQGKTYAQIAEMSGRAIHKLENLHYAAVRKLRLRIQAILGGKYNVPMRKLPDCPLCRHYRSDEIDELIRRKSDGDTWRGILKTLKTDFGIPITSPQQVIGHKKYHMI